MGLNLKLHAEDDININITTDDDTDPVEEQIAEQETTEAVEETSEELETVAKFGMNIVAVIDNLTFLKGHVEKFGVTKQFLHLCNGNGQLNAALGTALPHYESDDIAEDIDLADVPETDVIVEDFKEKIGNAYETVKKFFKMIWEKLESWFSAIFTRAGRVKKSVEAAQKRLSGLSADTEKFGKAEAKVISKENFSDKVTGLMAGVGALMKAKITSGGATNLDLDGLNKGLAYCGKKIVEKDGAYASEKVKDASNVTKQSMSSLGWTPATISEALKSSKNMLDSLATVKNLKSVFKTFEAAALKEVKTAGGDGEKGAKKKITSTTSIMISAVNALVSAQLDCASLAAQIANKVPGKKEEATK